MTDTQPAGTPAADRPEPRLSGPDTCQIPGEDGSPVCVRQFQQRPCRTCPAYPEPSTPPAQPDSWESRIRAQHPEMGTDAVGRAARAAAVMFGAVDPPDPTHGRIDRDIQAEVDEMRPTSLSQRVAIENTLQARRDARRPARPPRPFDDGDPAPAPSWDEPDAVDALDGDQPAEPQDDAEALTYRWRVGRKVPRNLYEVTDAHPEGRDVGRMDTPKLAAMAVEAVNAYVAGPAETAPEPDGGPGSLRPFDDGDPAPAPPLDEVEPDHAPGWDRCEIRFAVDMIDAASRDPDDGRFTVNMVQAIRALLVDRDHQHQRRFALNQMLSQAWDERDAARAELAEVTADRMTLALVTSRRDASADALEWAASQWVCATPGGSEVPYTADERADLAAWAAEVRSGARTVHVSPEPAPDGGGEADGD